MFRNIILRIYCWYANFNTTTPQFTVWAVGPEGDTPEECDEFFTLEAALDSVNALERVNDPDARFWVEDANGNIYDDDYGFDDPCGYCGTSQNPNDICRTCFNYLT